MKIQLVRDSQYAPCGYLVVKEGMDYHNPNDSVLIQTDWEFPGLASNFGFIPCECGFTDGTVDCGHKTASQMIADATFFLDSHIDDIIEDPGYFVS
jgi:hypothetical protein